MECVLCKIVRTSTKELNSDFCHDLIQKNDRIEEDSFICRNKIQTIDIVKVFKILASVDEINNAKNIKNIFKVCFQNHSVYGFLAVISLLNFSRNHKDIELSNELLKLALKKSFMTKITLFAINNIENYVSHIEKNTLWSLLVTSFVSLPSQLYNNGHVGLKLDIKYSRQLYGIIDTLMNYLFIETILPEHTRRISYFLQRLIQSGHGFLLPSGKSLNLMLHRFSSSESWVETYRRVLEYVDSVHHETIIVNCVNEIDACNFVKLFPLNLSQRINLHKILTNYIVFKEKYTLSRLAVRLADVITSDLSLSLSVSQDIFQCLLQTDKILSLSFEKYLYFFIICLKIVPKVTISAELCSLFMDLVPKILDLTDYKKSNAGKFFVQHLTAKILPSNEKKLLFDVKEDESIVLLKSILNLSQETCASKYESDTDSDDLQDNKEDNDQEYFDTVPIPLYLRDSLTGLQSKDDAKKVEASLIGCSKLICTRPSELCVVSEELTATILHNLNHYSSKSFIDLKTKCIIDLITYDPIRVVSYLTSEFSKNNINILQRIEILHALSIGASKLNELKNETATFFLPLNERDHRECVIHSSTHTHKINENLFHKYYHLFLFPLIHDIDEISVFNFHDNPLVLAPLLRSISLFLSYLNNHKVYT
ncbi:hypothetical protein HZS_1609 [Henneguya salminicola]|nr:hypothetical protein HZS_1609 [Henneguya salminicola]